MWEARRLISPALKAGYRIKLNEDICVPRGHIVEMLARRRQARAMLDRAQAPDRPIARDGLAGPVVGA